MAPTRTKRFRAIILLLGAAACTVAFAVLSVMVIQSQERARNDIIARFAERGRLTAQLMAGSNEVSSARQGADAQVRLSGDPTQSALDAWEGEADPGIPYTALYDGRGRLLAVHPSSADPVSEESGRRALRLAIRGRPSTSGVVSSPEGRVVEAFVPFPAQDGLRILVIGQPLDVVAQFAAGNLKSAAGVPGGSGYVVDRSGTLVAAVGEGAQQRAAAVGEAIRRGRTSGQLGDQRLVVSPVQSSGLLVALTAPEEELTDDLPSTVPPRVALAGLAVALLAVFWLAAQAERNARRLEVARHAAEEASRTAARANVAKSEFVSLISHELRTPLTAILGFGELLEMEELSPRDRESTEQIIKGGKHVLELINELMDISRIESGTLRLSLEPVAIGDVTQGAVDLIRPLAEGRAIRLHTELEPHMRERHVMADRQRLGQVLLNLLSNAVKYNKDGGTISLAAVENGGRIRIGVTDTGPGIPPDKISLLFAPFERLGAEHDSVEGTGLGLALSKNLVELMAGTLEVDTVAGEGTTFWVELAAAAATAETSMPSARTVPGPLATQGKVLFIEDNLSNQRLIEQLLVTRRATLELITATTGASGIAMAQREIPDVILLDLHLPDLPGDEVLRRLRSEPRTRAIPVVIMSADATPHDIKRLRASWAVDYLTKPVDVEAFLSLMDRLLG